MNTFSPKNLKTYYVRMKVYLPAMYLYRYVLVMNPGLESGTNILRY